MISDTLDRSMRGAPWPLKPTRLAALSIFSIALVFGCGNDGANGVNGGGAANGGGATNGSGATGGNGAVAFSGAVLCSLGFTPTGTPGFIRLVPDEELEGADQGQQIDSLEGAIEFAGGVACAVQGRSVFAFDFESPTITRFDEVDGALVEGETVSFANFGLSSLATTRPPLVFVSNQKAYYLDGASEQLIVWNPEAMETIGSIPLTVSDPPEGLRQTGFRVIRIDDQVVTYNNYQNEQQITAARTDFWWIDPETDEIVATDVTEQCGNLQTVSTATNGDTYIGMSGAIAMEHALGLPGSFPPCAIRIRAGTREVDPTYLADFNALTGGLPTSGPIPVENDRGLLLAYDTSNIPIDPTLTARELAEVPSWNFYEWELGTEQPATLVESIPTGPAGIATREFDGRAFLARVASDRSSTELLDLTQRPVEVAFTLSEVTLLLARLGTEPDVRMAQRIEHLGGFGVLLETDGLRSLSLTFVPKGLTPAATAR